MKHLVSVLFGANYANIRQGMTISAIVAEESLLEDNCRIGREWWERFFKGRQGVAMGEVLVAACDINLTSPYMAEIVIAACYKIRSK
jgi:hypothetical protein